MRTPALASLLVAAGCGSLSLHGTEEGGDKQAQDGQAVDRAAPLDVIGGTVTMVAVKDGDTKVPATLSGITGMLSFADEAVQQGAMGALTMDLSSWTSGLALRDERVRAVFFDVESNPTATFSLAALDGGPPEGLAVGQEAALTARGTLYLAGGSTPVTAPVQLRRVDTRAYHLDVIAPVSVSIAQLQLTGPLDALVALCKPKSIADGVQISASLQFGVAPPTGSAGVTAEGPRSRDPAPAPSAAADQSERAPRRRPETAVPSPEMRRRLDAFRGKRKLGKGKGKRNRPR